MKRGSCIRNLKTPQKPFCRKGEGGVGLVVANFLVSGTLFLRSGHGQEVPPEVSLHPKNVIPCSDTKGPGPRFWDLHPPRPRFWLRGGRAQLAASSGPRPNILSSCHRRGSQALRTQLALTLLKLPVRRGQVLKTVSQADGHCY